MRHKMRKIDGGAIIGLGRLRSRAEPDVAGYVYLDSLTALGADHFDAEGLFHDALDKGGDDRIDIIETLVKHLEFLFHLVKLTLIDINYPLKLKQDNPEAQANTLYVVGRTLRRRGPGRWNYSELIS